MALNIMYLIVIAEDWLRGLTYLCNASTVAAQAIKWLFRLIGIQHSSIRLRKCLSGAVLVVDQGLSLPQGSPIGKY
jgi:hypothetical protein